MICPNCGTPAQPGIGFGNICVKFKTFICDLCKTSHQAISHRVKSSSMSTWTMEEVMELTTENKGGNEVALHVWLANAPRFGERYPGGCRPKEGDKVEVFKQFVTDCYEHGKFMASTPFRESAVSQVSSNTPQKKPNDDQIKLSNIQQPISQPTPQQPTRVAQRAPSIGPDLLAFDSPSKAASNSSDFGSFQSQPSGQNDLFSTPAKPLPSAIQGSCDFIDFGDFCSPSIPVPSIPQSNPLVGFGNESNGIQYTQNTAPPHLMSNGHSNPSSHDPFQGAIISSVSMPNFSTVSSPPAATGAEYGQQQQSRPKSTLDLASLYDQPTQPNNSIQNAISSAFGDGNSSGGSMMFPSNGHMQSSGSMNQMNGNRNQMNGNMNPMNGNNGNMNPMNGNMNQMNGNMNQMNGNMNQMNGNMNQMNGNMNQMNGNMNQMNGSMNLMNGNSEQYQNTNFSNSATGISNMMAADNNYKKNYNVGTFQQSNNNQNLNSASGWGMQGAQNGHQMATPQMNDFGLQQPMQYQQSNFNQIQQPQQQQPQQQQYQQNYNYSNQQQQQLQPAHMSQQAAYRGMVTNTVASNGPMDAFESIGSAMKNQNRGPY
jgi:Putative GTPase activating protein for Arf